MASQHQAIGALLSAWRALSGVLQQDLAAQGCVSATVVRRIEKGDYESAPPQSLIAVVARQRGPARELQELAQTFKALQDQQRQIDKMLGRKILPADAARAAGDEQVTLVAGLRPAALPCPPSVFVGRQRELDALTQLLDCQRLVTVVGPGGIGKTALCLRLAQSRPPAPPRPWFADLSCVRAGEPLLPWLARLILDEDSGTGDDREVTPRLGATLGDTPALIILDNCEHLVAAVAAAATELLNACPGVRILATSREPLHLPDESVLTIGPLPVTGHEPPLGGTSRSQPADAVDLFIRLLSKDLGDEVRLNPRQAAAAADLCRQLDGIPLRIELAAARARTLPVRDVATSVRRGLAVLSGGRRDIPRHQAIEAAISWSWDLLTQDEQRALARLAVLTAPFTLQCGAAVAAEEVDSGERLVAALADKSLLSQEMNEAGDARLKILTVVRNFAIARLSAADRQSAARRLMAWALTTIPADEITLQQSDAIERIDMDFPLIRVALELGDDSPAEQVRLALAIWHYWHIRSLPDYGCQFLAKACAENISLSPAERGRALGTLASLLAYQGHFAESIEAAERSIEVRRTLGDPAQLRVFRDVTPARPGSRCNQNMSCPISSCSHDIPAFPQARSGRQNHARPGDGTEPTGSGGTVRLLTAAGGHPAAVSRQRSALRVAGSGRRRSCRGAAGCGFRFGYRASARISFLVASPPQSVGQGSAGDRGPCGPARAAGAGGTHSSLSGLFA